MAVHFVLFVSPNSSDLARRVHGFAGNKTAVTEYIKVDTGFRRKKCGRYFPVGSFFYLGHLTSKVSIISRLRPCLLWTEAEILHVRDLPTMDGDWYAISFAPGKLLSWSSSLWTDHIPLYTHTNESNLSFQFGPKWMHQREGSSSWVFSRTTSENHWVLLTYDHIIKPHRSVI